MLPVCGVNSTSEGYQLRACSRDVLKVYIYT